MKVHIERLLNIISLLKQRGFLSRVNYSSINNATFAFDEEKEKFDISDAVTDFQDYFDKIPKDLNDNIIMIYRLIGDHNKELYLDDWCFMPLKDAINRHQYYLSKNQDKLFDIAYKYDGMGHIRVLSCDLQNHLLFYRGDGGSNDYEREFNLNQAINYKREYVTNRESSKRRKINSRNDTPYTYMMFKEYTNELSR
jgi:hypothetical protein